MRLFCSAAQSGLQGCAGTTNLTHHTSALQCKVDSRAVQLPSAADDFHPPKAMERGLKVSGDGCTALKGSDHYITKVMIHTPQRPWRGA
eukprot:1158843-Pelagomonas_calceolata.AAC.7